MTATAVMRRVLLCLLILCGLPGCTAMAVTGAVVGTVTAVAVEVVEVPFEVAGGIHDVMTDDDDEDDEDDEDDDEDD